MVFPPSFPTYLLLIKIVKLYTKVIVFNINSDPCICSKCKLAVPCRENSNGKLIIKIEIHF